MLFAQLISRGVVDLTNNSDLFTTVLDMLATLIHSTLVTDRDVSQSDRSDENRKHHAHSNLVKKLKKEIGESNSVSIKYLRQLLPFPKVSLEALVSEPFGIVTDAKGNKTKAMMLSTEKKQGLQVGHLISYSFLVLFINN